MAAEMNNRLHAARHARGWSQAELAEKAGLSRQTVLAIEQAKMMPSTAIALRLAQLLHCRVEELFWLPASSAEVAARWHGRGPAQVGERVKLAWLGASWHAFALDRREPSNYAAVADAVVRTCAGPLVHAEPLVDPETLREQLVIAGCDPSLGLLVAHFEAQRNGGRAWWHDVPSGQALALLAAGAAHAAGVHLIDPATGQFNRTAVDRALPGRSALLVRVARWDLGWLTRSDTPVPLDLTQVVQLGLRIINRPQGAGARDLLDRLLHASGVPATQVRGYDECAAGHFGVGQTVALGHADIGIATKSVATAFGLEFQPLQTEDFDLVVPAELAGDARLSQVLDMVGSSGFRRELAAIGGYDLGTAGQRTAID